MYELSGNSAEEVTSTLELFQETEEKTRDRRKRKHTEDEAEEEADGRVGTTLGGSQDSIIDLLSTVLKVVCLDEKGIKEKDKKKDKKEKEDEKAPNGQPAEVTRNSEDLLYRMYFRQINYEMICMKDLLKTNKVSLAILQKELYESAQRGRYRNPGILLPSRANESNDDFKTGAVGPLAIVSKQLGNDGD